MSPTLLIVLSCLMAVAEAQYPMMAFTGNLFRNYQYFHNYNTMMHETLYPNVGPPGYPLRIYNPMLGAMGSMGFGPMGAMGGMGGMGAMGAMGAMTPMGAMMGPMGMNQGFMWSDDNNNFNN